MYVVYRHEAADVARTLAHLSPDGDGLGATNGKEWVVSLAALAAVESEISARVALRGAAEATARVLRKRLL